MMNLINAIPDHIGWMMVGALGMACCVMSWQVGKVIYIAIKERMMDDEAEEC